MKLDEHGHKTYEVDGETFIKVSKPAKIVDGFLKGDEIVVRDTYYQVWTSKHLKAKRIAEAHGFEIRLLDKEAEIFIPKEHHGLLSIFGAKKKREMSSAQKEALAKLHQDRGFAPKTMRTEPKSEPEGKEGV